MQTTGRRTLQIFGWLVSISVVVQASDLCATIFEGERCETPKQNIPECVGSAFRGGSYTLHKGNVLDFSNSSWLLKGGVTKELTAHDIQQVGFCGGLHLRWTGLE